MSHRRCFTAVQSVRFAMLVLCLPGMLVSLLVAQDADAPRVAADSLVESVLRAPAFDMDEPPEGLVLWSSEIGSSAGPISFRFGNVFAGTNNSRGVQDRAVMAGWRCLDGRLLWQVSHERLRLRVNDLPGQSVKSKLTVDGDRGYYVSNRGELVCLDVNVPIGGEGSSRKKTPGDTEGRIVWTLDMIAQLGVFKRDAGDIGNPVCSPVVLDRLVYCLTGHGSRRGYSHLFDNDPPAAPSFVAVDKLTGEVVWSSSVPGDGILVGQWASPIAIQVEAVTQVVFPGGDGVLYGFHPTTGELKWSLDCNPPQRSAWTSGYRGTRCFFAAKPTVADGVLYASLGQGIETPAPLAGPVVAVDLQPIARGNPPVLQWTYEEDKLGHISGEIRIADSRLVGLSQSGNLLILDKATGQELWRKRVGESSAMLASPCVYDKRILVATDSELLVFALEDQPECLARYRFSETIENSPVVRDGTVYLTTRGHLWALDEARVRAVPIRRDRTTAARRNAGKSLDRSDHR